MLPAKSEMLFHTITSLKNILIAITFLFIEINSHIRGIFGIILEKSKDNRTKGFS